MKTSGHALLASLQRPSNGTIGSRIDSRSHWRLVATASALLGLLFLLPSRSLAGAASQSNPGAGNAAALTPAEAASQRQQLLRLQEGIATQKNGIEEARQQVKERQQELAQLDQRLEIHNYKCAALKESYARQEQLLAQEQERLQQTLGERLVLQKHLEKRLTAYYQIGSIGLLNVVFSRKSLAELLSFQEYFHYLVQYDQQSIDAFKDKISEQQRLQEKFEQEKARLVELVNQLTVEEKALADTYQEKTNLLELAKTQEQLYGLAMIEIEKAAVGLTSSPEKQQNTSGPEAQAFSGKIRLLAPGDAKQKAGGIQEAGGRRQEAEVRSEGED